MSYRLAWFLSYILHPVLMPTYALLLIFSLNQYFSFSTTPQTKLALYTIIAFNTLILPILASYLFLRRGYIKSFNMEEKHERSIPFITQAVLMMIAYYMLLPLTLPKVFYLMLLGAITAVVIVVLVNLKWKISIHMVGIGGITGMLFGLSGLLILDLRIPIIISFLVAGFLGTARLRMGAHLPPQIYVGYLVGFVCEYLMLNI